MSTTTPGVHEESRGLGKGLYDVDVSPTTRLPVALAAVSAACLLAIPAAAGAWCLAEHLAGPPAVGRCGVADYGAALCSVGLGLVLWILALLTNVVGAVSGVAAALLATSRPALGLCGVAAVVVNLLPHVLLALAATLLL